MRALVQRVSEAAVSVDGEPSAARIGPGLLVLLGVRRGDGPEQADRLAGKLERLRVFEDADGRMNLSVRDVDGELLCVSQFTLYGDARKGNRPSYVEAAPPEQARAALRAGPRRARRAGRRLRGAHAGVARQRRSGDAAAGGVTLA